MPFHNFPYIFPLPTERKATDILACNCLNIGRLFCGVRGILSTKATASITNPRVLIPLRDSLRSEGDSFYESDCVDNEPKGSHPPKGFFAE